MRKGLIRPELQLDEAVGNSKVFTCPATQQWEVCWAYVDHTSTATAGTRQLVFEILTAADVVQFSCPAGATQIASLQRFYTWGPCLPYMAAFVGLYIVMPIPGKLIVPPGYKVRLRDSANIAVLDTLKAYLWADRQKVA